MWLKNTLEITHLWCEIYSNLLIVSYNFENFYFLGKRTLVLSAKRWRICKFIRKKSLHRPRTLSPSVGPSTNCAFFLGLLAKEVNSTEIARSG